MKISYVWARWSVLLYLYMGPISSLCSFVKTWRFYRKTIDIFVILTFSVCINCFPYNIDESLVCFYNLYGYCWSKCQQTICCSFHLIIFFSSQSSFNRLSYSTVLMGDATILLGYRRVLSTFCGFWRLFGSFKL